MYFTTHPIPHRGVGGGGVPIPGLTKTNGGIPMTLFTNFKAPSKGHWQTAFMMMLKAPKGVVNVNYELDDNRCLPSGCREPKDWDKLPCDCSLAIDSIGRLCVDVGDKDSPDIIGDMRPEIPRTLLDCFLSAFRWYWMCNSQHDPRLHSSWYEDVEMAG